MNLNPLPVLPASFLAIAKITSSVILLIFLCVISTDDDNDDDDYDDGVEYIELPGLCNGQNTLLDGEED